MRSSRGFRLLVPAALLVSVFGIVAVDNAPVHAATITVNTLLDPGPDGTCSLRDAVESANTDLPVSDCAQGVGNDIIVLPAGTVSLAPAPGPAAAPIAVTAPLVIRGTAVATSTISGPGVGRVFVAEAGASLSFEDVTLQNPPGAGTVGDAGVDSVTDVTLTRSRITAVSGALFGSGILALGNVILTDSQIDNATGISGVAITSLGGAVALVGSTINDNVGDSSGAAAVYGQLSVTVTGSTFTGNVGGFGGAILTPGPAVLTGSAFTANSASRGGGGVAANGAVTVTNSTFTDNVAQAAAGGAVLSFSSGVIVAGSTFLRNQALAESGGAIGASADVSVTDTYFNGNSASFGGAIFASSASSVRSTFSGNSGDFGSAIGVVGAQGVGGTFDVVSSTFDGNITPGGSPLQYGGALYSCLVDGTQLCVTGGPTSTVRLSTFAGNVSAAGADVFLEGTSAELTGNIFGATGGGTNCAVLVGGTPISLGANISEEAVDSCSLIAAGDLTATSAQLGPLQLNAPGTTPTRAIPMSSPAFDHVPAGLCMPNDEDDQRGVVRGNGTNTGLLCDAGAYEFDAVPPPTTTTTTTTTTPTTQPPTTQPPTTLPGTTIPSGGGLPPITPPPATVTPQLPATGSDPGTGRIIVIALCLLTAGLALLAVRRRQASPS